MKRQHIRSFASYVCARHSMTRQGLPDAERAIVAEAAEALVIEFAGYAMEGCELATRAEFVRRFLLAIKRRGSAPSVRGRWDEFAARLDLTPFSQSEVAGIDLNCQMELRA